MDSRSACGGRPIPAVVPANFLDITPLEVFDNLSVDPSDPNFVVNVLQQNSTLINAQVLAANTSVQRGIHRGGFGPDTAARH